MKKDTVIKEYRNRIKVGERTKLKADEQNFLIQEFVRDLLKLTTELKIKERCQQEIKLLEEGYPKETVGKSRLNRYRKAIQEAVNIGRLKLTPTNSKQYTYEKKEGTEKTGGIGQAHHHFAWLYMAYDNDTYVCFNERISD
jgi:Telomere resolvase